MSNRIKSLKPIATFHNRQMVQYLAQVDLQQRALQTIQSTLPKALAIQTHDCVIKDRKLLIYTHSAAWASQLRFFCREIQTAVSSEVLRPIDKVQFRILQQEQAKKSKNPAFKVPAIENIELIRGIALSTPDSKLKTALFKLSNTLKRCYEDT